MWRHWNNGPKLLVSLSFCVLILRDYQPIFFPPFFLIKGKRNDLLQSFQHNVNKFIHFYVYVVILTYGPCGPYVDQTTLEVSTSWQNEMFRFSLRGTGRIAIFPIWETVRLFEKTYCWVMVKYIACWSATTMQHHITITTSGSTVVLLPFWSY